MSKIVNYPKDGDGDKITRAMGSPRSSDPLLRLGSTVSVDVFDMSDDPDRLYVGFKFANPSGTSRMIVSFGEGDTGTDLIIPISTTVIRDAQAFGPGFRDNTKTTVTTKIRARLESPTGTLSSGVISYAATQPVDEQNVLVNGKIYEFSDDLSKDVANDFLVQIGVDANASWANFAAAVNTNEQAVTAVAAAGPDTVTITSNYGGIFGDGLQVQDGPNPTGVTFPAGNVLAGGAGGILPVFEIW